MEIAILIPLITGSVVTSYIQHLLKQKESASLSQRSDLEKRYREIILLMYAVIEFKESETSFGIQRPDLKSQNDILQELKAEWYNMLLFASQKTQNSLCAFIETPDLGNLKVTAISMRIDLGRGNLGDSVKNLKFKNNEK